MTAATDRTDPKRRYLIVNADDFGRARAVNRGVVTAHELGIVTSASLMVRWPSARAAAKLSRQFPGLGLGLHLDLGEWSFRHGEWIQVYDVVATHDDAAVREEIGRQLETFRDLVGTDPTHLDCHQNADAEETVSRAVIDLARELQVPVRNLSPGLETRGDLFGQTSRGLPFPEGLSFERLASVICRLGPGITELRCHPAAVDSRGRIRGWDPTYSAERGHELEVLCDPRLPALLDQFDVELRSFGDVRTELTARRSVWERTLRRRGRTLYEQGEFDAAARWFRHAIAVDEARPWAWLWLARAEHQLGDHEASKRAVTVALERLPGWPPALLHLADLESAVGGLDASRAILHDLIDAAVDDIGVLQGAGGRLLRLGDPAGAVAAADRLLAIEPDHAEGLFLKAVASMRLGDRRAALSVFDTREGVRAGRSAIARARLYLEIDDPRMAWEALRGTRRSEAVPMLIRVGNALRGQGHLTAAAEAFAEADAIAPNELAAAPRAVSEGEITVLAGRWAPPPLRAGRVVPHPRRVLHVVGKGLPHFNSGYTIRTQYIAKSQLASGLEPHVVTQLGFPWNAGVRQTGLRVQVEHVPYHCLVVPDAAETRLDDRLAVNASRLLDLVLLLRPAVLHAASDFQNALLAFAVGRSLGLPVVYEARGFWEETWLSKRGADAAESEGYRWRAERELAAALEADRVVTLGEAMRDELVRRGVPGEKVAIVPNAVDTDIFVRVPRDRTLASAHGIRPRDVVLGYISSFVGYEGIHHLIEATALLLERGHRVRTLLVGDGEERARLERCAADLGIADRVVFTGRVAHADVLRYYGLIDVFVVPRTPDRVCSLVTPLKPFEAMATQRTLVVSGLPALREIVEDGKTGLVFEPGNSGSLADTVEAVIGDPGARARLGVAARRWVCEHRTWAGNGARYREIYESIGVR